MNRELPSQSTRSSLSARCGPFSGLPRGARWVLPVHWHLVNDAALLCGDGEEEYLAFRDADGSADQVRDGVFGHFVTVSEVVVC